jgi:hypothetical protein
VSRPPPLPDLDRLSTAEKDALIVGLWQTIDAMSGPPAPSPPEPADAGDLRRRISLAPPSRRAGERRRTGRHPALRRSRLLFGLLAAVGIAFGADLAIGAYQERVLAAQRQAARELENAAFAGLVVELTDVAYEADGTSYRATLRMQNSDPAAPLYIMLDPARVFVQTGLTWQGVTTMGGSGTRVVRLDGTEEMRVAFGADVEGWTELMPGYMHVLIESPMLISRSSEPTDDLIERTNRFYVYLKPQGADDAAIKRRMSFPGDPPIFIPMPPH